MTVFYGVDPSDVRKQTGDFGRAFNETCARKTEKERQKWSQDLTDAGNIAGEHFHNWDNEADMIEKISRDVSNKLNTTISWDFQDIVGIEAHLEKMQSFLHLECDDEVLILGISGPAGIGKTTIARALHSRLASSFQLTCFMENIRGSYNNDLDEYGSKLYLQEKLLSKILNQNGLRIYHLGAIPERLCDQKVLIILDDVNDLKQLEALVNETSWFGPGSRIIIITEDQEILAKHDINNTYHVDFPTKEDSRKILCRYAFRRNLARDGFEKLVERVTELCGNLPLGLRVIGSTLRGKNEDDWGGILHKLESSLDRDVEGVLRVGYENLHEDDQLLFLLIAFFFNYKDDDHVKTMLADSNLDVRLGLKTLAYKSLIHISNEGKILIHTLLQQVARKAVQRQEPWRRQILIDTNEICDVLENDSGSRSVMGISLDTSTLSSDVYISPKAFKRIPNLRFLRIYGTSFDRENRMHVPEDMHFPSRLKLLHWEVYPEKCLPYTFRPEYLVELSLEFNELEKLWEGIQIQPLTNLKKMSLARSIYLKELPDLSKATNLERLTLDHCFNLVEIPSSIGNLQKLKYLDMEYCLSLQVVPTQLNLASLESVNMLGCGQLRKIPDIFKNIIMLLIADTMIQDLAESIRLWSRLQVLIIFGDCTADPIMADLYPPGKFPIASNMWVKRASYIKDLDRDIEEIPDCIKDLHRLKELYITGSPKLASLPELPPSLRILKVANCESLETLMPFPFGSQIEALHFANCLKLSQEIVIITQQSRDACLPGRNIPAEFDHRVIGNSLIIPSGTKEFRLCVVISRKQHMKESADLLWCQTRHCLPSDEI